MDTAEKEPTRIDLFLAADAMQGNVDPCNDQVWRLTSEGGEPTALALATSYGLRAYGMRLFPRFHMNSESITNPNAYHQYPSVHFSAGNFAQIHCSPFPSIDVNLRLWVPTSQVLVGQVSLELHAAQPESLRIEWVTLLEPFPGGSGMSAVDQRINTILAGKTRDLEPVFLLTGMPQANFSTYPSLTSDVALQPSRPRQFTWVISSLETRDLSFYTARRYTAANLEAEQLKIEMSQRNTYFFVNAAQKGLSAQIDASQMRMQQLILPPFGKFSHPSIVASRTPDTGFSHAKDGSGSGASWGIQTSVDVFLASRILLPSQPHLVKELLQNILDQQSDDDSMDLLTSWSGRRSGMKSTPLLAGTAVDVFAYTQDIEWLKRVFPTLLAAFTTWFPARMETDAESFPAWQHPLQTGLIPATGITDEDEKRLGILIRTCKSPALAAMLYHECNSLIAMARLLDLPARISWLEQKLDFLSTCIQSCWNEQTSLFEYCDLLNHSAVTRHKPITYRRNGGFPFRGHKSHSSFTVLQAQLTTTYPHPFEIRLQTDQKTIDLTERSFQWHGNAGFAVVEAPLSMIQFISLRGLKKSEVLTLDEPAIADPDASAIAPFWAGAATPDQLDGFLSKHLAFFEAQHEQPQGIPALFGYMLLETLIADGRQEKALTLFEKWFVPGIFVTENNRSNSRGPRSLEELIPLRIFLSIYGIEKWTGQEMILKNGNALLPSITVQYEQASVTLDQGACVIDHANGESTTLDQAGKTRIIIA